MLLTALVDAADALFARFQIQCAPSPITTSSSACSAPCMAAVAQTYSPNISARSRRAMICGMVVCWPAESRVQLLNQVGPDFMGRLTHHGGTEMESRESFEGRGGSGKGVSSVDPSKASRSVRCAVRLPGWRWRSWSAGRTQSRGDRGDNGRQGRGHVLGQR